MARRWGDGCSFLRDRRKWNGQAAVIEKLVCWRDSLVERELSGGVKEELAMDL